MKRISQDVIDLLQPEDSDPDAPPIDSVIERYEAWTIPLNPTQRKAFDNKRAKWILLHGERASGKTIGALHALVDHCFNTRNGLALIIVEVTSMGEEGGAWHKLNVDILPQWNSATGLSFTPPKLHPTSRKPYIWIQNRHGGSSRVLLLSVPVDAKVMDRMKGMEPTFVLVDEAQTLKSDAYFRDLIQQVGRRKDVADQRIFYCCNPRGPSHWLYKRFFEFPVNDNGDWNEDYACYHVPISENIRNIPRDYYDRLIEACRADPIEAARMIDGRWIDRPEGEAIFKDVWVHQLHVKPSDPEAAKQGIGLWPKVGHVVLVGFDLGPAHTSVHFMQSIPVRRGEEIRQVLIVFDEMNYVGQYSNYRKIAPRVVARMAYWDALLGTQFKYDHIAGEDAFNQIRSDGSFDAWIIQNASSGKINLRSAPRGPGSVPARVRLIMELLQQEELLISAACVRTIDMFKCLEVKSQRGKEWSADDELVPAKGPHLHVFDSLSYPIFTIRFKPGRYNVLQQGDVPTNELVYMAR